METLIIDDQPIIKSGLIHLVKKIRGNAVVSESPTIRDALKNFPERRFDLIIAEIEGELDTVLAGVSLLNVRQPNARILIYSRVDEFTFAVPMIRAGASGFVSKHSELSEVSLAVQTLLNRGKYLSTSLQSKLICNGNNTENPHEKLSGREMMVMQMLIGGKTNKEIAFTLGIKNNTVSTFKQRLYKKFSVSNPVELARKLSFHASSAG